MMQMYNTKTFSVDAFWGKDECFSVWSQKVKGHSMTKCPGGGRTA